MSALLAIDATSFVQVANIAFDNLLSLDWYKANYAALINILMIDIVLAGDNAIVVGLAASRVEPSMRAKVIFWGIAGAVILRILFASIANQMLLVVGLTLAGGLLLLFVCWKMYREIVSGGGEDIEAVEKGLASQSTNGPALAFWPAVTNIVIADVSMSLDNVLAVAGAAKGEPLVLVVGLAVAVVLMALASTMIARLLSRYHWITWIGLLIILYVALDMIFRGSHEVFCQTYGIGCSEGLVEAIKHRLGLGPPGPSL